MPSRNRLLRYAYGKSEGMGVRTCNSTLESSMEMGLLAPSPSTVTRKIMTVCVIEIVVIFTLFSETVKTSFMGNSKILHIYLKGQKYAIDLRKLV